MATSNACLNCGLVDSLFIEISKSKNNNKAVYFCVSCYDDYIKQYIVLAYCESCGGEFATENDDAPFVCKTCMLFHTPSPEQLIDTPPDASYEDYERHGYLGPKPKTLPVSKENICVSRALKEYVEARKNEDFYINKDRAFYYYRELKGLPDTAHVLGEISVIARTQNKTAKEMLYLFAAYDRVEEGLVELVAIAKEHGYLAYDAIDNDLMELKLGNKPKFYDAYLAECGSTLCRQIDDNLSTSPF